MSNEIEIEYNTSLGSLEDLLSQVSNPGEFFTEGSREIPMPTVTVSGIGILSFPIQDLQVRAMIQEACLAPYGKGEDTVLDTSVRKTWQISPNRIQITGKSWQRNFDSLLKEVKENLGCLDVTVSAEFYKLLIYDEGGFFLPHRDSEKSPGMFGTLVIALPSSHEGGQLVIRHRDSEAVIDLSGAEPSELKFCAFYADCEHEVLPVTKGYRVCLVYNLIQRFSTEDQKNPSDSLKAPCRIDEIQEASNILKAAFNDQNQPAKLVWLLEHQYSKAELSFRSLKNTDSAVAKVLITAADSAGCAIHLGIVHIEESGSAEADFGYYSGRSRRGSYEDNEMDVDSGDYEIIDICEGEKYIDGWIDPQNNSKDFGRIPIEEDELLPFGALDGEEPDEQRLLEATGNAGVSFERAYHRAALILWPKSNYIQVLLQSGIKSAVAYFKEQMDLHRNKNDGSWKAEMNGIASAVIDKFEYSTSSWYSSKIDHSDASEMLFLLCQTEEKSLIERLVLVIGTSYGGSENDALITAARVLQDLSLIDRLFSRVFEHNIRRNHLECIRLYRKLTSVLCEKFPDSFDHILLDSSRIIVHELNLFGQKSLDHQADWSRPKRTKPDSETVVLLWEALTELNREELRKEAVFVLMTNQDVFDAESILTPALAQLHSSIKPDSPLLDLIFTHKS